LAWSLHVERVKQKEREGVISSQQPHVVQLQLWLRVKREEHIE